MQTTKIKFRRTVNGGPPDDLEPGEPSVEFTTPPKLWIGVPAAVHADERLLLVGDPTLPAGGAQYDVLTKASAADHDVGWQRMVRISGDTMTGPLVINRNTEPPAALSQPNRHALRIQGMDNQSTHIVIDAFNSFPMLFLRRANGTAQAPSEVVNGNELGRLNFTTGYNVDLVNGGFISCIARGDWSATTRPCSLDFFTPLGATGIVSQFQMAVGPDGVRVTRDLAQLPDPAGGMLRGDLNAERLFVMGVAVATVANLDTVLPTGGAQYDVLTKSSATATDPPTWAGAGERPSNNTVIGGGAFNLTATGSNNTVVGSGALPAADFGNANVAVGREAMRSATSGASNIAIGMWALRDIVIGGSNVAVGHQALQATTASNNIGVGYQALLVNTTGADNVGIGQDVLWRNTSGSSNAAMGYQALYNNTTGEMNVGIGRGALFNITGLSNYNVAIGTQAGRYARLGGGSNTGTTGSIYIGFETRSLYPGETNTIVIGSATSPNVDTVSSKGSNTIVLGNDNITALYTRAGLVLGSNMGAFNDVSGAKGPGTVNATGYFLNGQPFETVTGPLRFVGSYDPTDGEITASSGSPAATGPLPAAAPVNEGWVLIVSDEGEGQAPAPVVDMHPGDWLISDGTEWIFHEMHLPALIAENVMLTAISGLTADNVQDAIEELHTALDEFEALPNGGDEYEVLSKQSATDFDVGWSPVGVRPNDSIGIGPGVLAAVTTGTDNVAIGINALALINTGSTAVAIGNNALAAATNSLRVTAVGHNAMANATGFDTTAVGFNAAANVTGSSVAIGANALADSATSGNIAIGSTAGRYLTTNSNIAIGGNALAGSSTLGSAGTNNIAIGGSALASNTNTAASSNVAVGGLAQRANNNGYNVAIGELALRDSGGGSNVVIGYAAMCNISGVITGDTNSENVAIGREAGRNFGRQRGYSTLNQNSVFIGHDASPQDATGNINQIVIGHNAHGNGSHTATIGSYWTTALYAPATLALRNNSTMLQVSGSQAPIPNNEIIASIEWQGLHGVPTYNTYHRTGAVIRARTLQTWAATAAGARLEFLATPNGTTTPEPRMTLSQGLTVGDLTVVDRGPGTVNASGGYFLNGEPLVVTNRSVSWLAGSNPEGAILAYADRDLQIVGNLLFICENDNGEPATVRVVKAAANTSLLGGTPVTGNFNTNTPPGTYINLTPTIRNLDAGERLGLLTDGNFQISAASITVRLA